MIALSHLPSHAVSHRYNKLLLFLGFAVHDARELKINHFCKVVSEFALEYRTTKEKVVQMLQKKANQRERKKTRGKMIVDVSQLRSIRCCIALPANRLIQLFETDFDCFFSQKPSTIFLLVFSLNLYLYLFLLHFFS